MTYLPRVALLAFLGTCRRTHAIGAKILYRSPDVYGQQATLLFTVLASSNKSTITYGALVRRLSYHVTSDRDINMTYPIFCMALFNLPDLISLSLVIDEAYAGYLLHRLRSNDIIRHSSIFFSRLLSLLDKETPPKKPSLQNLQSLSFHGDINLIQLVKYRNLTSVEISRGIGNSGLATVIEALTLNQIPNDTLRSLSIVFAFETTSETIAGLWMLGESLPGLEYITLRAPVVNALVRLFLFFFHARTKRMEHRASQNFLKTTQAYFPNSELLRLMHATTKFPSSLHHLPFACQVS